MARTYDAVTFMAAAKAAQEGRDKHTADDELDIATRYRLIAKFGGEIRQNEKLIRKAGRDRLERHASIVDDRIKLGKDIESWIQGDKRIEKNAITRQIRSVTDKLQKEVGGFLEPDAEFLTRVKRNRASERYGAVSDPQAFFAAIADTSPFDDAKFVDFSDPSVLQAQRQLLQEFSSRYGLFDIDNATGKILNEAELLSEDGPLAQENNPFIGTGEHYELYVDDPQKTNFISRYNREIDKSAAQISRLQANIDTLNADAEAISADNDSDAIIQRMQDVQGKIPIIFQAAQNAIGSDLTDIERINQELADVKQIEEDNRQLRADQKRLRSMSESGGPDAPAARSALDQDKLERATAISNDWWREWAADHGFDELGRADLAEDGTVDVDSYVAGRDDLAAFKAFNREQKRGAGRYGFQSIGTGDIVRVTIDGRTIVGERLKYHSADRPGSFRVMVPGEVEPILVNPGDTDEVFIVERDPEKVSVLAKRAKRRLRRGMGDRIDAATEKVSDSAIDVGDAAEFKGQFITTQDGRHLTDAEWNETVDREVRKNRVVAKVVDGQTYFEGGDGTVYIPQADGTYEPYNEERGLPEGVDDSVLSTMAAVRAAPARTAYVGKPNADGILDTDTSRPLNFDDVQDNFLTLTEGEVLSVAPIEGEPGYVAPDRRAGEKSPWDMDSYDLKLRDQTIDSLSLDQFGLKGTSEFRPYEPPPVGESRNIGGFKFTDLTQSPRGESIARPGDPPKTLDQPSDPTASTDRPLPQVTTATESEVDPMEMAAADVQAQRPDRTIRRTIQPEAEAEVDPVMETIESAADAYDAKPPTEAEAKKAEAEIQKGAPSEAELFSQMMSKQGLDPKTVQQGIEVANQLIKNQGKDGLDLSQVDLDVFTKDPKDIALPPVLSRIADSKAYPTSDPVTGRSDPDLSGFGESPVSVDEPAKPPKPEEKPGSGGFAVGQGTSLMSTFDMEALEKSLEGATPEERKKLINEAREKLKRELREPSPTKQLSRMNRREQRRQRRKARREQIKGQVSPDAKSLVEQYLGSTNTTAAGVGGDDPAADSGISSNIVPGQSG